MRSRNLSSFFAIVILLISCKTREVGNKNLQTHKNLITFNSRFLRDLTVEEFESYNYKYGKGGIKQEQHSDTLLVTTDFPWDGCANMVGDLRYQGDSLILVYRLKDDTLCSEIVYYRLQYKILNKEKVRYKFGVEFQENEN